MLARTRRKRRFTAAGAGRAQGSASTAQENGENGGEVVARAIEAMDAIARSSDQQEVRGLAQRSADAAREIKDLISTSSRQVEEGVKLVTESGVSLPQIVSQVSEVSGIVSEIAVPRVNRH
jgi:methyl-accepting chemotaxis protein